MKVIPVLDLRGGVVVRGVAGRRHEYRPVVSRLTPSAAPADVARAIHSAFGLREFYVADLDAIAGAPPALAIYTALKALGLCLWVDAGAHGAESARAVIGAGVDTVVFGLETLRGPDELTAACKEFGGRVVFSLDLKGGVPLGDTARWRSADPFAIASEAVGRGVRRLIALDLERVGVNRGVGTGPLCARLADGFPDVEVVAGGGVRGPGDLLRLRDGGVRAALVASALHDGALRPEDLARL